ncbi:MAG TPA: hypothetical protein VJB59_02165 [Bdellovibrionota bacterium]|nr:hypothetical protein [Bdellovibrionota bacterium]
MKHFFVLTLGILLLVTAPSPVLHAGSLDRFSVCGRYRVIGDLLSPAPGHFVLRVFTGSLSETTLELSFTLNKSSPASLRSIPSYCGMKVELTGTIPDLVQKQRGRMNFESITEALSAPRDPAKGDGFHLLEKTPCAKSLTPIVR